MRYSWGGARQAWTVRASGRYPAFAAGHAASSARKRRDKGERLVDHHVMLGLGDLDIRRAGSDEAQEIGGVLGLEELRLRRRG